MEPVRNLAELEALYESPVPLSLTKVVHEITPLYREWIAASRLVFVTTVGPEGTDCSPRGDDGPVVRELDPKTLLLPDWRGNNRIDSLRNIVRDGRASLMFLVPGSKTVIRTNGRAIVTTDPAVCESFEQNAKHPRSVIAFTIEEMYTQCAKAFMRSRFWERGDESSTVPSAGQLMKERDQGFDAADYDSGYAERAEPRMW